MHINYKYKDLNPSFNNNRLNPYQWITPSKGDKFCQVFYVNSLKIVSYIWRRDKKYLGMKYINEPKCKMCKDMQI
jgi:hypothetical protein